MIYLCIGGKEQKLTFRENQLNFFKPNGRYQRYPTTLLRIKIFQRPTERYSNHTEYSNVRHIFVTDTHQVFN